MSVRIGSPAVAFLLLAAPFLSAQQSADPAAREQGGGDLYLAVPESVATDYDVPPKLLKQIKPKYPNEAFKKKIEGTVLVEFIVETTGDVRETRILESVPGLDEAAVRTVRSWRFSAARLKGVPVRVIARAPVSFCVSWNCSVRKQ